MPLSPFAGPLERTYLPSGSLPGTLQVFNMDVLNENANPGQQGTQIDALGHFAYLDEVWDGTSPLATEGAHYYGGRTQKEVKPTPDSPLLELGMEKVPPIVTTAVLLDAKTHVGGGEPMEAGETVTPQHIEAILKAQGLEERGILPGDVVYVYTGWSDHYRDPDTDQVYYSMAPGLSFEAAKYLGERRVVAVGLDTPFVDAIAEGQLAGSASPPAGSPPGMAFPVHHYLLTQSGIHNLENIKLDELVGDRVSTSCTIVLPLREKGSAGSPIRPVAIGVPGQ
jgi:kynurenine formamidase